jgi:hypothetical protein
MGERMRRTVSIVTGIAATIVCLGGMSVTSSAFAMGCINPQLAPTSLAQDVRPDDQHAYDQVAVQGNHCASTAQQVPASAAKLNASLATKKIAAKAKITTN